MINKNVAHGTAIPNYFNVIRGHQQCYLSIINILTAISK